jgi:hypothetical protein
MDTRRDQKHCCASIWEVEERYRAIEVYERDGLDSRNVGESKGDGRAMWRRICVVGDAVLKR